MLGWSLNSLRSLGISISMVHFYGFVLYQCTYQRWEDLSDNVEGSFCATFWCIYLLKLELFFHFILQVRILICALRLKGMEMNHEALIGDELVASVRLRDPQKIGHHSKCHFARPI